MYIVRTRSWSAWNQRSQVMRRWINKVGSEVRNLSCLDLLAPSATGGVTRLDLLKAEKELTRRSDELARRRGAAVGGVTDAPTPPTAPTLFVFSLSKAQYRGTNPSNYRRMRTCGITGANNPWLDLRIVTRGRSLRR